MVNARLAHPSPPIPASVTGDYGKNLPRLTVPRRILKSARSPRRRQASARVRQLSAGDAARRHRPALRGAATEAEQCLEERDGARPRAGPPLARRRNLLLALALLHRLDHAALALDRRERAAVDIVDVAADLQLAGTVDERVLIGQQHPDLRRQLNVLLAGAEHALDLVSGPVLVRARDVEENFGIFSRILHAHAAMAVSAHIVREHVLVRRVVLIDQEPVGEVEAYSSERVGLARRLIDVHAAVAV